MKHRIPEAHILPPISSLLKTPEKTRVLKATRTKKESVLL